jgi:hypothetical protein
MKTDFTYALDANVIPGWWLVPVIIYGEQRQWASPVNS